MCSSDLLKRVTRRLSGSAATTSAETAPDCRYARESTIARWRRFTDQPPSMKSAASQSSRPRSSGASRSSAGRINAQWNGALNNVLGGWSLGPIITVNTGMPLNLSVNGNPSNTGGADRPNVVGDWHLANPTVQQWFNTAAFVANAPYTYGNAGRNVLRSPGRINLDLAAHKTIRLSERISAQIRLESFNATNTPALGNPNTTVGNPLFGQITSAGAPRDNQVALKLQF